MRKNFVTSKDGSQIYYEVHSVSEPARAQRGSASPTLFLIHGIGGDTDGWQFVREPLNAAGFTTVSMDVRGHGYSHHPKKARDYDIKRMVEDIEAVLVQEKIEKPILIGHSGGAIIAAQFAASHPDHLGGLVLIAGSYLPPPYLSSPLVRWLATMVIRVGAFISPPAYKPWHSPYPPGKHHKEFEVYGLLRTMFYNSLRSYLHTSNALVQVDLKDHLHRIDVPTLLIAGEHDGIFPVHISQEMHRRIPNAHLVTLDKTNHVSILNNPLGVVRAIQQCLSS
jgi:pimeloyl-ACP methyl ester carboxylesterase